MITTEEIKEYLTKDLEKYDDYMVEYDNEHYRYKTEKGFYADWILQDLFRQWYGHADKLRIVIGGGRRYILMELGKTVFMAVRMGLSDGAYLAYSKVRDMDELKTLLNLTRR